MADTAPKIAAKEHHESSSVIDKKAGQLADQIRASKHFIVFTGAGISTSAGIPDFRGPDGSWTLLAQGRERTKKTTSTLQAIPTPAHMALVALQDRGLLKYIVSQNCDGLHRRSGISSGRISEVHGNSNLEYCKDCGKEYLRDFRAVSTYEKGIHDHRTGRRCVRCGGALHDTIINFDEPLPAKAFRLANEHAKAADLCLVIGSSCTVSPANEIPNKVGRRKAAKLVICNLQETPLDNVCSSRIFTTADDLMVRVMEKLGIQIPAFILRRRVCIQVDSSEPERPRVTVQAVDADGTPMSLLQSVKVEGSRRASRTEPHILQLRDRFEPGTVLKLELEFMGHYREPSLVIEHESSCAEMSYLLEFDPHTGVWKYSRHADGTEADASRLGDKIETIVLDD